MLNPPLSLLSEDVLDYIVEHVAAFEELKSLSLADRAFTRICQRFLFRTLKLGDYNIKNDFAKRLTKINAILNKQPSFANRVRTIQITITHFQNKWVFESPILIAILQLLAKSPRPPHELHFGGAMLFPLIIVDSILVVDQLIQSFYSQTLTTLHLKACKNIPLPILQVSPRLKVLTLHEVETTEKSYANYPDNQCSGRESPALEVFTYRGSHSLVRQMINPPPRFHTPVVLWSKLRVLRLCPYEEEEMACLQPILDAGRNTLEELHLTELRPRVGVRLVVGEQLPLAGLVNLSHLSALHVFGLYLTIKCDVQQSAVLHDINTLLNTIPTSNKITNLMFYIDILGRHPFGGCLDEDWAGLSSQIIRISADEPLELDLRMEATTGRWDVDHRGEVELYERIMKRTQVLLKYPKICTHVWNPTSRAHGLRPLPLGEVRNKCRR